VHNMKLIYATDEVKLDAKRITEYTHPLFGEVTVFHDVIIASEMVQPYEDGKAFKSRDELEAYAWTVDNRWVIVGGHPVDGIISERDQVAGRTVNPRYVKDLLDPKTKRPCRAGDRADVEIFNDRVPKTTLDDMKNGKKSDVSIGFFYSKDDTPGIVEDGPFKGDEYDYIQRNMFHDHTAVAIEKGRCPSPYCGLTADEIKQKIVGDPFAGFPDWDACVAHMMKPKKEGGQGYTKEVAEKACGSLKAEHEKDMVEETILTQFKEKVRALLDDEYEAFRGEYLAKKETEIGDWWRKVDWTLPQYLEVYDALPEDTRTLITEAHLCPTCGDKSPRTEAERAMSHFDLTKEEWEALSEEEKKKYIDRLPDRKGEGEDEDLPYEDGPALDFTLTPVDEYETDTTVEAKDEKKKDEQVLDIQAVLERATRVLASVE